MYNDRKIHQLKNMRKWKELDNKKKLKRLFYGLEYIYDDIYYYVKRVWYWIRCHTYNRYHIIDIRCKDYKWGWIDQDHKMFLACFKCLEDYVEGEKCFETIDFEWDEEHRE